MGLSTQIRQLLVESPSSLGARARAKRWELTRRLFPDLEQMNVVDLGGTVESWKRAPIRPARVTVLNLFEPGESDSDWITPVVGDARYAKEALEKAGVGSSFDLVFSNAVIEHVGGHSSCIDFARSVHELAPHHWVQTPYRYFPVEPHWLFPGMQFLPVVARAKIAENWRLAHSPAASFEEARTSVLWTQLVSITEMREYFPDSVFHYERAAGLVKSIIAVKA